MGKKSLALTDIDKISIPEEEEEYLPSFEEEEEEEIEEEQEIQEELQTENLNEYELSSLRPLIAIIGDKRKKERIKVGGKKIEYIFFELLCEENAFVNKHKEEFDVADKDYKEVYFPMSFDQACKNPIFKQKGYNLKNIDTLIQSLSGKIIVFYPKYQEKKKRQIGEILYIDDEKKFPYTKYTEVPLLTEEVEMNLPKTHQFTLNKRFDLRVNEKPKWIASPSYLYELRPHQIQVEGDIYSALESHIRIHDLLKNSASILFIRDPKNEDHYLYAFLPEINNRKKYPCTGLCIDAGKVVEGKEKEKEVKESKAIKEITLSDVDFIDIEENKKIYCDKNSILDRRINKICEGLKNSIRYVTSKDYELFHEEISSIRGILRSTTYVILKEIFPIPLDESKANNVSSFFKIKGSKLIFANYLRQRNINIPFARGKLEKCIYLFDAIDHIYDDDNTLVAAKRHNFKKLKQIESNASNLMDFFTNSGDGVDLQTEQKKTLLSFVKFYNALKLTSEERKNIEHHLRIQNRLQQINNK